MDAINYTDNWNAKLLCDCWPDVRMPLANKYEQGTILQVTHDRIGFLGYAKVVAVKSFKYCHITDNMAYTVTGNSAAFLRKMLNQFYENINNETNLVHVILKWTQRNPESLHPLFEKHWTKILSQTPNSSQYADGPHQQ